MLVRDIISNDKFDFVIYLRLQACIFSRMKEIILCNTHFHISKHIVINGM